MRRTPLLVAAVAVMLAAAGAPRTSAGPVGPCHKHYSVADFHRYAKRVLPGPVTHGQDMALRRLAHCQRYPANIARERRWRRAHEYRLTRTVISGRISVFGGGGDEQSTADGGGTGRACIAMRRPVRDELFFVQLGSHHGVAVHCDWGPADWTGRAIDATPALLARMRVWFEPTDMWATATLIRVG